MNDALIDNALRLGGLASGAAVGVVGLWYGRGCGLGADATLLLCLLGGAAGYGLGPSALTPKAA